MKEKEREGLSRRSFLRGLAAGTAGLAAGSVLPGKGLAATKEGDGDVELATLLDLRVCEGCGACVEACRESNAHKFPEPEKPFPKMYPKRVKVEDWSDKRDVDDRLTPYNWLYIDTFNVEYQGEEYELNMPRRCLHCVNPPCANLCPWGAARKQENGVVRIDADICLGGSKCKNVCPWHIPQRQTGVGLYLDILPRFAGNGVMYKCDRCADRLEQGELPACIEACPMGVQTIGPRDEIVAKAKAMAAEEGVFLYGLEENGGTNTIYVSPVPFHLLNKAREKGPGRPHLKPVENSMADENYLAAAMLAAPVAGLAAGVLKAAGALKKSSKEADNE